MFKEIKFTSKIIVFNESLVCVGKKNKSYPYAIILYEEISGCTKDDIISTYYAFFLANKDRKKL